jgi:hypothetical protein
MDSVGVVEIYALFGTGDGRLYLFEHLLQEFQ